MTIGNNTAAALKGFVERIERLEDQKKAIADDIKQVFAESKSTGFDTKALKKVIAIRKMDPADRRELNALIDTYMHALDGGEEEAFA